MSINTLTFQIDGLWCYIRRLFLLHEISSVPFDWDMLLRILTKQNSKSHHIHPMFTLRPKDSFDGVHAVLGMTRTFSSAGFNAAVFYIGGDSVPECQVCRWRWLLPIRIYSEGIWQCWHTEMRWCMSDTVDSCSYIFPYLLLSSDDSTREGGMLGEGMLSAPQTISPEVTHGSSPNFEYPPNH